MELTKAAQDVLAERKRQMEVEGWTPEHDDEHAMGELAMAAALYVAPEPIFVHRDAEDAFLSGNTGDRGDRRLHPEGHYRAWPFDEEPKLKSRRDNLVRGIALALADLERLDRVEAAMSGKGEA